ncbi:MAG: sodium:solute symporter [Planctomycetota bacterium]|nr:sodium:solute symporter [Planctomycetota bacterium]
MPVSTLFAQADPASGSLSVADIVVIVIYTVGIVILGCWAGLRKRGGGEAKEYFLAGGTLRWPVIGLALFATNISCVHLVSLAQSGYDSGLLNGNFEWMAAFTLVLLGLFFAPFYIRSGVTTLPDFLEKRYSRQCRDWLAVLSIVSAVTIHIGFSFLTGGIVLKELFGIDMYTGIVVVAALTGIYTIIGGLMAVVVTEAIQTVVLVLGAAVITYFAWDKIGGWEPMVDVLREKGEMAKLSMLRPHGDADGLPWYAVFLGYPVLGIWYWCADQTIVQRVLGAKDEQHARVGPLFAGLIKVLPVFIFVLPGLMAYALVESGGLDIASLTSVNEAGETEIDSKGIYGVMITQLLPQGLVGLMVAALLAALMSTVAGALNSISTLFSYDLYKRFRPDTSDRELVFVGRLTAGVALVAAIGLVPLLDGYPSIFNGLNDIIAHIAPPVTCVFVLGVFWPRASAVSAKLTLWFGSALGAGVFLISKLGEGTAVAEWLNALSGGSFMMMAFYLLCACVAMQVVFSLIWPSGERERSSKLYWASPLEPLREKGWPGIGNYKLLSVLLIGGMAVLYSFFR